MVTLEPEKLRQLKDVASVPEEEELLSTGRTQKVLEEGRTQENQAGPSCVRSWGKIPGLATANAKGPGQERIRLKHQQAPLGLAFAQTGTMPR